ncbi:MAG: hypothetical protein P8Y22_04960 [Sulfurimonas sp.]
MKLVKMSLIAALSCGVFATVASADDVVYVQTLLNGIGKMKKPVQQKIIKHLV